MTWVSKKADGETIVAEAGQARVEVVTRGGNVTAYRGCIPGDHIFAKLVKAAYFSDAPLPISLTPPCRFL